MLQISCSWQHVSAAVLPSSGQLIQIKRLQCAYNMGSHSVYNHTVCGLQNFNSVFRPHTVWLYTLWDPILYAHWRRLICIIWPKDGRSAAETCCHEPLICSTQLCEFTIVVYDVKKKMYLLVDCLMMLSVTYYTVVSEDYMTLKHHLQSM